jgi:succinyl-CoA synthetase beta subunit
MNLHEYQAKQLFSNYGIPVPSSQVVDNADQVKDALTKLAGNRWVIKAQVHAGGRGKAGGVKLTDNADEAVAIAKKMLGSRLVTYQTGSEGQPVRQVLIEETCNIERELYLGAVVDRASRRVVVMASTEGGVEIEKVAEETPEKILKIIVDPLVGVMPYQCRELAFGLGLKDKQIRQFTTILTGLGNLFMEKDLSLLEVNPLIVTAEGDLLCLDGKINIDENALFRQPDLIEMRDISQENPSETRAREWELSYIALDGNIGCMVNGAGLAMATMDVIKLHGGEPANFLDVGGGATRERVTEAFKIILSDSNVQGILVNIFGGIVRCDLIADGILQAVEEVGVQVPVVVRLEGNNADKGKQILNDSKLNVIAGENLTDAAKKVIAAVSKR